MVIHVNRFQRLGRLSNRRLWIAKVAKGSLFAWRPAFHKDSTSTAQVFCRKRYVCVRSCRSAMPCTPVHTENFFDLDPFGRARRRTYRGPYCMARLYVVAFSKNKQQARRLLAETLLCVYNPDSPSGQAPRAQSLIGPAQFASRTNWPFISGLKVIYEHEHFRGRVPSQPWWGGQADRGKTEKTKSEKFEMSKISKSQKTKSLKTFTIIFC